MSGWRRFRGRRRESGSRVDLGRRLDTQWLRRIATQQTCAAHKKSLAPCSERELNPRSSTASRSCFLDVSSLNLAAPSGVAIFFNEAQVVIAFNAGDYVRFGKRAKGRARRCSIHPHSEQRLQKSAILCRWRADRPGTVLYSPGLLPLLHVLRLNYCLARNTDLMLSEHSRHPIQLRGPVGRKARLESRLGCKHRASRARPAPFQSVVGRGVAGCGVHPAIVRAQRRAVSMSVMPGNKRRSSTAAENSPP